ncbi:hypothetical protein J5N97_018090 [Dioscorea zingiberensis]|uniref:RING-type E3 ubiquitin transferase n=1 Tax=Dioscorea zingiberensis TaxID=325984 RepID=A0A9D5HH00_9LILI|nr:hypothetical protein J5N97_018090 [Dioscorea zingiberensis]
MSDFGTHWCYTCWRFVTIDGDVVCPLCNGSFIQDPNDMDNPWGAIREAASRGIDEIFNLEDYIHALMRNDTVDSSDDEEPWMDDTSDSEVEDDQIDYNSNCPALPSDSLKTIEKRLEKLKKSKAKDSQSKLKPCNLSDLSEDGSEERDQYYEAPSSSQHSEDI